MFDFSKDTSERYSGEIVDFLFKRILSNWPENEFAQSVSLYYVENGYLTKKQYQALLNINSSINSHDGYRDEIYDD